MTKSGNFFSRFFKYMFTGRISSAKSKVIIPVEEVDIVPDEQPKQKSLSQEQVKNQLIITINRVLVVICSVSFVVTVIYPFIYPDRAVPDVIQNAFFTTLGWFGGALGTFFQVEQNQK